MGIRDFEDDIGGGSLSQQLVYSINQIIDAAGQSALSDMQLRRLSEALVEHYPDYFKIGGAPYKQGDGHDPEYGANFDLAGEVNEQIKAVRALRGLVMDEQGNIRDGYTARDAKELISSSNTLLGSLMRFHDKIINQNRMRLIEQATIEAVKTLPEEAQELFYDTLQKGLEAIE